uniref:hypothetical protein n=1 Tax=Eubacterium cellulosolvens TaxID=29322 RepID=UPI000483DC59|nr:hypothetical protein [[Eubacterium] cellulosolvens]
MNRYQDRHRPLIVALCVILAAGLAGFLLWNRMQEAAAAREWKALGAQAGETDTKGLAEPLAADSEAVWTGAENGRLSVSSQSTARDLTDSQPAKTSSTGSVPALSITPTGEASDADKPEKCYDTISLRGDGFYKFGDLTLSVTGIGAYLNQALTAAGSPRCVKDYTMDLAGSLSQLRHAGVDENVISAYVNAHKQAFGTTNPLDTDTEMVVRDQTEQEKNRDDQDALPVIGIGFKGGFSGKVEELEEQVQHILNTYSQQEDYIILGYYPEKIDTDSARQAFAGSMTSRWGEHYLDLTALITPGNATEDGTRKAVAEAVAKKILEMGY